MHAARKNRSGSNSGSSRQRKPLQSVGPFEFGTLPEDTYASSNGHSTGAYKANFQGAAPSFVEGQTSLDAIARRIEEHITSQIIGLESRFCRGVVGDMAVLRSEIAAVYALVYELHHKSVHAGNHRNDTSRPALNYSVAVNNPTQAYYDDGDSTNSAANGWPQTASAPRSSPQQEASVSRAAARRKAVHNAIRDAAAGPFPPPSTDRMEVASALTGRIVVHPSLTVEGDIVAARATDILEDSGDGGGGGALVDVTCEPAQHDQARAAGVVGEAIAQGVARWPEKEDAAEERETGAVAVWTPAGQEAGGQPPGELLSLTLSLPLPSSL
jgi:hypothetical protein